jgi:hypothetical protein
LIWMRVQRERFIGRACKHLTQSAQRKAEDTEKGNGQAAR